MPDQKPGLDYRRHDRPRRGRPIDAIDIAITVVLSAMGLAFLSLMLIACWMIAETHEERSFSATLAAVGAGLGALLLWLAWANLKRQ